jgi:polyribonucleotide 5'-hydroxyl-kinase
MQRTYGGRGITIVKIPKSGGVVELDRLYRARVQRYQTHSYFYGEHLSAPPGMPPLASAAASTGYLVAGEQPTDFTLAPASSIVSFGDIAIWRIGEGTSPVLCIPYSSEC